MTAAINTATNKLVYEIKLLVRSEHVDMTRRMRMSELFRLLEDVSVAHTEALGCTRAETLDKGLLWIIGRQSAEIIEMPEYDDEIIVRGWQGDMMYMFFPRFYEIEKAGRIVVRAEALWALMDKESRSLIIPEDHGIALPGRPGSGKMVLPAIIVPKTAELVSADDMVTRFSQLDINGHMNNTRYFDIIDDIIHSAGTGSPADIAGSAAGTGVQKDPAGSAAGTGVQKDPAGSAAGTGSPVDLSVPKTILANYLSELRLGERFSVKQYKDGDTLYFEGAAAKPYFRIKISY